MGNYIRFDWAMKRLLRQKVNYVILEGLLSVLLGENPYQVHLGKRRKQENGGR